MEAVLKDQEIGRGRCVCDVAVAGEFSKTCPLCYGFGCFIAIESSRVDVWRDTKPLGTGAWRRLVIAAQGLDRADLARRAKVSKNTLERAMKLGSLRFNSRLRIGRMVEAIEAERAKK